MTPFDLAKQVYDKEPCARSFFEDLYWHMRLGYVFCTPQFFIMGRPVKREWPTEWILSPWFVCVKDPDCWHVWLASGDLSLLFSVLPIKLLYVSWERDNKLRFYKFDKVYERIQNGPPDAVLQGWCDTKSAKAYPAPRPD